jgi:hypothetical protein
MRYAERRVGVNALTDEMKIGSNGLRTQSSQRLRATFFSD